MPAELEFVVKLGDNLASHIRHMYRLLPLLPSGPDGVHNLALPENRQGHHNHAIFLAINQKNLAKPTKKREKPGYQPPIQLSVKKPPSMLSHVFGQLVPNDCPNLRHLQICRNK